MLTKLCQQFICVNCVRFNSDNGTLRYTAVMMFRIVLLSTNKDQREAVRLNKSLARYEFILLVVIKSNVLSSINAALRYLQSKYADLKRSVDNLASASTKLSVYRNRLAEMKTRHPLFVRNVVLKRNLNRNK